MAVPNSKNVTNREKVKRDRPPKGKLSGSDENFLPLASSRKNNKNLEKTKPIMNKKPVPTARAMSKLPDERLFFQDITGSQKPGLSRPENKPRKKRKKIIEKNAQPSSKNKIQTVAVDAQVVVNKRKRNKLLNAEKKLRRKESKRAARRAKKQLQAQSLNSNGLKDIWQDAPDHVNAADPSGFLPEHVKLQVPGTLKMQPLAKIFQPAVDPGHPGTSYQPLEEDHQVLVNQATKKRRTTSEPAPRATKEIVEPVLETQAPEEPSSKLAESQVEEENSAPTAFRPLPTPRVTHKERLRRKRAFQEKLRVRKEKLQHRVFDPTILRTKFEALDLKSLKTKLRSERRAKARKERQLLPQRLSKHKFQPSPVEILPTSDLPSSLRGLRPVGNLLKERYESFLKRNVIEPRAFSKKRQKKKLINYINPSYRKFRA